VSADGALAGRRILVCSNHGGNFLDVRQLAAEIFPSRSLHLVIRQYRHCACVEEERGGAPLFRVHIVKVVDEAHEF
jgi:hypothetical protein